MREQAFPQGRVVIEPKATTTYENAVFTRNLLAPSATDRWLIVTSAVHMPRAIGVFRRAGFTVESWPVFDDKDASADFLGPTFHEVFGLVEYRLLGRTSSLLPAPLS